jgi:hypothetical protein
LGEANFCAFTGVPGKPDFGLLGWKPGFGLLGWNVTQGFRWVNPFFACLEDVTLPSKLDPSAEGCFLEATSQ